MIPQEKFITLPTMDEFLLNIRDIISTSQRPANEVILNNEKLCAFLDISPRQAAYLRARREISYSRVGGKIYYRLSDVLDLIKRNEVKAISMQNRFNPSNQY